MSKSLWSHGRQQTRSRCPSLSPGLCPSSCLLSQWCHPTISSSVALFFWLQSFLASESFPMRCLLAAGGQSMGASALVSVLPTNIQGCFPLGLTGWISLQSKGLSRVFPALQFKSISSSAFSLLCGPTLTFVHDYWKNHSFYRTDLCQQSDVSAF